MKKKLEKQSPKRSTGKPKQHSTRRRPNGGESGAQRPRSELKLLRPDSLLLYGRNSVEAALENRSRECLRLFVTDKALSALKNVNLSAHAQDKLRACAKAPLPAVEDFPHSIPADAPHQGILLEVRPLNAPHIEELMPIEGVTNIILMLDQVTDPHNVGACMRSAAAFGARALITQDRNSPDESGVLARSAAGGLEALPWHKATNLAQTLETLKDQGYWSVGLDGHCDQDLRSLNIGKNIVLVMGSEGRGLRPLIRKNCDMIAKIPMSGAIESLNVSNAAAIALYELSQ